MTALANLAKLAKLLIATGLTLACLAVLSTLVAAGVSILSPNPMPQPGPFVLLGPAAPPDARLIVGPPCTVRGETIKTIETIETIETSGYPMRSDDQESAFDRLWAANRELTRRIEVLEREKASHQ